MDAPSAAVDPRAVRTAGTRRLAPFRCIRCWARMCACPRSRSATSGRPMSAPTAQPWLGDHQIHNVAALPGAAYCEMALAAARTVLGEASEVRDIRFEQMLLLDEETPVSAVASVDAPGVVDFVVETDAGRRTRRGGPARSCTPPRMTRRSRPRRHRRPARGAPEPGGRAPRCGTRSTRRAFSTGRRSQVWPRRTPPTGRSAPCWPRSRCPARSARSRRAYGVHPSAAGCLFPVRRGAPRRPGRSRRRPAVAVGCAAAARLRPGPQRPLLLHAGDQRRRRRRSRPTSTCSTNTARSC